MTRLGLTLNEVKTKLKDARRERFEFLGYSFGPHRHWRDGELYLGASPSAEECARLKQKRARSSRSGPLPALAGHPGWVERDPAGLGRLLQPRNPLRHTGRPTPTCMNPCGDSLSGGTKCPREASGRSAMEAVFGELGVPRLRPGL